MCCYLVGLAAQEELVGLAAQEELEGVVVVLGFFFFSCAPILHFRGRRSKCHQ